MSLRTASFVWSRASCAWHPARSAGITRRAICGQVASVDCGWRTAALYGWGQQFARRRASTHKSCGGGPWSEFLGVAASAARAAAWGVAKGTGGNNGYARAESAGGRFAGKVVVVTGAAGDTGRAGAVAFTREGAHVVLLDSAPKPLQAAERALQEIPGPDASVVICDNTNQAQVDAAVASIERKFGRITHLGNYVGYQGHAKPTSDFPVEDFQAVQDITGVDASRVLQCVAKSMQTTGGGVIGDTTGAGGLRRALAMPTYVAGTATILAWTMSAAKELAPVNIRVYTV